MEYLRIIEVEDDDKTDRIDDNLAELTGLISEVKQEVTGVKKTLSFINELLETERIRERVNSEMVGDLKNENAT